MDTLRSIRLIEALLNNEEDAHDQFEDIYFDTHAHYQERSPEEVASALVTRLPLSVLMFLARQQAKTWVKDLRDEMERDHGRRPLARSGS